MGQISVKEKSTADKSLCLAEKDYLFTKFKIGNEISQDKLNHNILITQITCK